MVSPVLDLDKQVRIDSSANALSDSKVPLTGFIVVTEDVIEEMLLFLVDCILLSPRLSNPHTLREMGCT